MYNPGDYCEDVWTALRKLHNADNSTGFGVGCDSLPLWVELNKQQQLGFMVVLQQMTRSLMSIGHSLVDNTFELVPDEKPNPSQQHPELN